jgi:hypothetical protein
VGVQGTACLTGALRVGLDWTTGGAGGREDGWREEERGHGCVGGVGVEISKLQRRTVIGWGSGRCAPGPLGLPFPSGGPGKLP